MGNGFKETSRTRIARRPDRSAKELRALYDDPIIIPHDAEASEQTSPPAENNSWPGMVLIGGAIVTLFCLWWLAPDWMIATWKFLIKQVFQFAGQ
jgi:hypothetical protein